MRLWDRFKMQAAQEVGINLTNSYNGHLTSCEVGSVGGQMVKKMCPYEPRNMSGRTVLQWDTYRLCST